MNIIVERARPADAEAILEYLKQVGGETDNLTFGAEGLPFTAESEAAYLAGLEGSRDGVMLVAQEDGKIVGNASLSRLPRRMSHRAEVAVSVLRTHWNRGIGGLLLQKLIDFARENALELIDLQVRSDNAAAIHLYEKMGFQKLFTYPAFFRIEGQAVACDYMCLNLRETAASDGQ